jgi:hypothetical protein
MEMLPVGQSAMWPRLKPLTRLGFVLYGGTAIALRIGHRVSVDFDFFSDQPLDRAAMEGALPFFKQATLLQDHPNTVTILVPENGVDGVDGGRVKLSFFGLIDIGRVGEPGMTEDQVMRVASLDDLMATKVKTVLQRLEVKDYQDIAAMIQSGVSLSKGLASARAMYGGLFQPAESLKALTYFEGGDLHELTVGEKDTIVAAVEEIRDLPQAKVLARKLTGK